MTKVDIFSGFLGAGKTTLIKKLIAEAYKGEKLVLIENEFGEIGIDGGFMQDAGIEVTEMNSGCICCSLVGDFGKALRKVVDEYAPDRILIEPSGVGKLSDVIRAVQNVGSDALQLNSFTAVVDANKCKMYMKNFGEFFNDQVEHANAIILSRTGEISPDKLDTDIALLREHNPNASLIVTPWSELTGAQILEAMEKRNTLEAELELLREESRHEHHHHDDDDDEREVRRRQPRELLDAKEGQEPVEQTVVRVQNPFPDDRDRHHRHDDGQKIQRLIPCAEFELVVERVGDQQRQRHDDNEHCKCNDRRVPHRDQELLVLEHVLIVRQPDKNVVVRHIVPVEEAHVDGFADRDDTQIRIDQQNRQQTDQQETAVRRHPLLKPAGALYRGCARLLPVFSHRLSPLFRCTRILTPQNGARTQ